MTPAALDSMQVLEPGAGPAVAFYGRWLPAFGADVIKVEPPGVTGLNYMPRRPKPRELIASPPSASYTGKVITHLPRPAVGGEASDVGCLLYSGPQGP